VVTVNVVSTRRSSNCSMRNERPALAARGNGNLALADFRRRMMSCAKSVTAIRFDADVDKSLRGPV
jgi:hypothetical protein